MKSGKNGLKKATYSDPIVVMRTHIANASTKSKSRTENPEQKKQPKQVSTVRKTSKASVYSCKASKSTKTDGKSNCNEKNVDYKGRDDK